MIFRLTELNCPEGNITPENYLNCLKCPQSCVTEHRESLNICCSKGEAEIKQRKRKPKKNPFDIGRERLVYDRWKPLYTNTECALDTSCFYGDLCDLPCSTCKHSLHLKEYKGKYASGMELDPMPFVCTLEQSIELFKRYSHRYLSIDISYNYKQGIPQPAEGEEDSNNNTKYPKGETI